jgi:hypothetical protein
LTSVDGASGDGASGDGACCTGAGGGSTTGIAVLGDDRPFTGAGGSSTTGVAVLGATTALRMPSSIGDSLAAHARTSTFCISAQRASHEIAE